MEGRLVGVRFSPGELAALDRKVAAAGAGGRSDLVRTAVEVYEPPGRTQGGETRAEVLRRVTAFGPGEPNAMRGPCMPPPGPGVLTVEYDDDGEGGGR